MGKFFGEVFKKYLNSTAVIACILSVGTLPLAATAQTPSNLGPSYINQKPKSVNKKLTRIEQVNYLVDYLLEAHPTFKDLPADLAKKEIQTLPDAFDPLKLFLWSSDIEPIDNISGENALTIFQEFFKQGKSDRMLAVIDVRDARFQEYVSHSAEYMKDPKFRETFASNIIDEKTDLEKTMRIFRGKLTSVNKIFEKVLNERPDSPESFKEKLAYTLALRASAYSSVVLKSSESLDELFALANHSLVEDVDDNILDIDRETLCFSSMMNLVLKSADFHSEFMTSKTSKIFQAHLKEYQPVGVGFNTFMDKQIITVIEPGSPAEEAGLQVKDILLAINNMSTSNLDAQEASSLFASLSDTDILNLKILRDGKELVASVNRKGGKTKIPSKINLERKIVNGKSLLKLDLRAFGENFSEKVESAITQELTKNGTFDGFLIDLRSNGGGSLEEVRKLALLFQDANQKLVYIINNPKRSDAYSNTSQGSTNSTLSLVKTPIVVLIDGRSASASEILAGSLKVHGKAIIVGSKSTFGKGSAQEFMNSLFVEGHTQAGEPVHVNLVFESAFKVTSGLYYLADGTSPQYTGVTSDIVIQGTYYDEKSLEQTLPNTITPQKLSEQTYAKFSDQFAPKVIASKEELKKLSLVRQDSWTKTPDKKEDRSLEEAEKILVDWINLGGV